MPYRRGILKPALLVIIAAGCSAATDRSELTHERVLQVKFSNAGEHTWLGLVLPEGGPARGEDEVWLCGTEGDLCTLRVRKDRREVELLAWSLGREAQRTRVDLEAEPGDEEVHLGVEFRDAGAITGRILARDGGVVGEAEVEIRKQVDYLNTIPEEARRVAVRTGDEGAFTLASLGAGHYSCRVTVQDHAPLELDFETDDKGSQKLVLRLPFSLKTSVLRGHVFDAVSLQPVKEFVVELAEPEGEWEPLTRWIESADGVFEWSGLPPGNWIVSVSAEGFSRFWARDLQLSSNETTQERFGLEAGRKIRGQVVDGETGAGIPDARVFVAEPSSHLSVHGPRTEALMSTRTNDLGWFDIPGMPLSPVSVRAAAEGYAESDENFFYEQEEAVEIALTRGVTVHGRVLGDIRPGALDGAEVYVRPSMSDDRLEAKIASVNESGEFVFHGLVPGGYSAFLTYSSGKVRQPFDIEPGDAYPEIEIRLPGSHEIAARVRGRVSGLPMGEVAKINLLPVGPSARVDTSGYYEAEVLARYLRTSLGVELSTSFGRIRKRVLLEEGDLKTVNFSLRETSRLRGQVRRSGTPAEGVSIKAWLRDHEGFNDSRVFFFEFGPTGPDGWYEIAGLSDGEYSLHVGERNTRTQVKGDTRFDLDLCGRRTYAREGIYLKDGKLVCDNLSISGRVGSSGKSLANASVVLLGEELAPRFVATDDRGAFLFRDLIPGDYRLAVHKGGYALAGMRVPLSADAGNAHGRVEVAVELAPTRESPFRVTSETFVPGFVILEVADGRGEGLWYPLPLYRASQGSAHGLLPLSLTGWEFKIKHPYFEPVRVQGWQGQDLEVNLSKCGETQWQRCLGWEWREWEGWPYQ